MEETLISRQDKTLPIQIHRNQKLEQKSMTKSKIKAMKSRIFWSRNNSQSSIEKVKAKLKLHPLNKLQEERQRNLKLKDELVELAKKLSLPKLKQSISSLHCNQSQVKKRRKKAIQKKNILLINKQINEKLCNRNTLGSDTLQQILFKYNKRCQNQIGLFNFGPSSTTHRFFDDEISRPKNIPKLLLKNEQNSGCVPKNMVKYLTKYVR